MCEPGKDDTCGKRYDYDYDHKYTYSRIGWNLKASDFQAAVGVAQMERLQGFIEKRRHNWQRLYDNLKDLPVEIVEAAPNTVPSWFGFAFMTDRRNELARYLNTKGIGTRPIMGGNQLRQPAYRDIEHKTFGSMDGANKIHDEGIWVGCWPGLDDEQIDYTSEMLWEFYE